MVSQADFNAGLRSYWTARERQALTGRGEGAAGAVRGGRHFDTLQGLVAKVFLDAGFEPSQLHTGRSATLPGYYRPTKDWDLVVVQGRELVAAFELKSLGGPSFGNNFNNRAEEAIGNATDVRCAHQSGNLGTLEPWLGYFYLIEDAPGSRRRVSNSVVAGKVADELLGLTYQERAEAMCLRLQRNGLYDAVCFAASSRDPKDLPVDPNEELSWPRFVEAIHKRIADVRTANIGSVERRSHRSLALPLGRQRGA